MTPDFTIDPEFRDWIIPLTAEEFSQLNQNLIEDGCRDPLVVWRQNGVAVLVDGHHRYTICKANNIPFRVEERQFSSREEAKNWIILNQLGRRNISPAQRAYLIGKIYRETKKAPSGRADREFGEETISSPKTAERIAEQFNVSDRTVKNAEKFADAVEEQLPPPGRGASTKNAPPYHTISRRSPLARTPYTSGRR